MFIGQNIASSMAYNSNGGVSDQQLQQYIDQVMMRYDTNRNGTLEAHQLANFFNELFRMCGIHKRINQMEATGFMRQVDTNYDGKANKFELFRAFRSMLANQSCNNVQSDWSPNFGGYSGNTGFCGGYGGTYGGGYVGNYGGGYRGNMW